jgi:hypothetical protein
MSSFNFKSFEIIPYKKKYYIQLNYTIGLLEGICIQTRSESISFLLNISYNDYVNIALKKYDGEMDKKIEVCFTSLKNVNDFVDWLTSKMVLQKLKGSKD